MKLRNIYTLLPFLILLLIGFCLRLYQPQNYLFAFDQVQILQNAQAISQGDFKLIGPMTGPAQMFTGPLIYYITAFWFLLIKSPYALVATSLSIYIFTSIALYFLLQFYIKDKLSLIYFSLWILSPFLISLDRVTWNPNLIFLSAMMIFFPLLKIVKLKKIDFIGSLILFGGCFLGYQAHFSGLILPFSLVIIWILFVRKKIPWLILSLSGVVVSLLPTIFFDWRHEFLNTHGLINFLTANHKLGTGNYGMMFWDNMRITIENIGKLLFWDNNYFLIMMTGLVLILAFIWFYKATIEFKFVLTWLILSIFALSVYKKGSPEYYFIIQFPAIIYLISWVLGKLLNNSRAKPIAIIIFAIYSILIIQNKYQNINILTIGNQLEVKDYLQTQNKTNGVAKIIYDMKSVDQQGLDFLLSDFEYKEYGQVYHIVYPYIKNTIADANFGELAIWQDPRNETQNYLELPSVIIAHSSDIKILRNYYLQGKYESQNTFSIFLAGKEMGIINILNRKQEEMMFDKMAKLIDDCIVNNNCQNINPNWIKIIDVDRVFYAQRQADFILTLYPLVEIPTSELSSLLQFKIAKN